MTQASIEIRDIESSEDGWRCHVTVDDGRGVSNHQVTIRRTTFDRVTRGNVACETLLEASFQFLLEREPKEQILRQFDLELIGLYFPEYDDEMMERLAPGKSPG